MHPVLVLVVVALWAGFTQHPQLPPVTTGTPPSSSRTAPVEGFISLANLNLGGVWPVMSRAQVVEKLGEPKSVNGKGWEDFGEVQILWNEEPEKRALGLVGDHLFDMQEPIASVGDPLRKVLNRIGLPQELHSDDTRQRHVLNYVPNNLRIIAVGDERGEMADWKVQQLNWGKSP